MGEPPVTITSSRYGASAFCHLCDWRVSLSDGMTRLTPAVQRATVAWAKHWHRSHTDRHTVLAEEARHG